MVLDPFMGVGVHGGGRGAHGAPLPRLRHRPGLRRGRPRAGWPPSASGCWPPVGPRRRWATRRSTGPPQLLTRRRASRSTPRSKRKSGGVDVAAVATDRAGREWLVDVVGGFTVGRPGLRRTDVLERTLGRAARLSASGPSRLLVLATDVPGRRDGRARRPWPRRGAGVFVDVLPVDLPAERGRRDASVDAAAGLRRRPADGAGRRSAT